MKKEKEIKISGIRRAKHFESGGDIAGWRGRARRFSDQKKEAQKRACRKGNYDG